MSQIDNSTVTERPRLNDAKTYHIEFTIRPSDAADASRANMRAAHRSMALVGIVGLTVATAAMMVVGTWAGIAIGVLPLSLLVVLVLATGTTLPYRAAVRRLDGQAVRLVLDCSGINVWTPESGAHLLWSSVDQVIRGSRTLAFARGGRTLTWVPTAAIETVTDLESLLADVGHWIAVARQDPRPPLTADG